MSLKQIARHLRRNQTEEETELWRSLRGRRFAGFKFRRQHTVGDRILDFYCADAKLAVELDGVQHGLLEGIQRDETREKYLAEQGIETVRFWNHQWRENREGCLLAIWDALQRLTGCVRIMKNAGEQQFIPPSVDKIKLLDKTNPSPRPSPRLGGERESASPSAINLLCPACGLCCNGVLFADVELQKGDNAGRLIDLGMSLKKKGMKRAFVQPCRCFDGKLCRIYADRPKRCATFECGLLKRVQAGEMPASAALKRIADAKKLAEKVRRLLRQLGDRDEQLALTKRYSRVMSQPIDLAAGEDTGEARGELMLAVNDLMHVLQREFLK
jgi:very-short-patch-repair endonuclease/Fe-S-cluster containining protein